jgi:hypothetical protein
MVYSFSDLSYLEFAKAMNLLFEDTAPGRVGEFGFPGKLSVGGKYYRSPLVQFMEAVDASWGYWALNVRKPDGEWERFVRLGVGSGGVHGRLICVDWDLG